MSRISWQMCDIFEVSNCIRDRDLDWSSRERTLSGCLVESLVSGFSIHLRIGLSEEEGDAFLGALGVNKMEDRKSVV